MITLYHNPACSKSRRTLDILRQGNIPVRVINYLQTPPSDGEVRRLLALLNLTPRDLLRRNEAAYKECGLDNPEIKDADIIRAMHENPILIQRPIAVSGDSALIARPPERILDMVQGPGFAPSPKDPDAETTPPAAGQNSPLNL